jgi:hypothetical protein
MAKLDKSQEKLALRKIWAGDGYFADSITEDDLNVMMLNIDRDFPIFTNTSMDHNLAKVEDRARDLYMEKQELAKRLREFEIHDAELCEKLQQLEMERHCIEVESEDRMTELILENLEEIAVRWYGIHSVVKKKIEMKLALSEEQTKYVLSRF